MRIQLLIVKTGSLQASAHYRIIILISLLFQRQGRVKLILEEVWQLIIIIMALKVLLFHKLIHLYPGRRIGFLS